MIDSAQRFGHGMASDRKPVGAILAGGAASRFGGELKGLLRVGGERVIDRVARALAPHCEALVVVSSHVRSATWLPNAQTIADVVPGAGALGGVHAALKQTGHDVVVVAWDMPFVPAALVGALVAGEGDVVVPWSPGPRGIEPLCAHFRARSLPQIEASLATGRRAMVDAFTQLSVHVLSEQDVRRVGDPDEMFFNLNRPEDLALAEAIAERQNRVQPNVE